jgi:hypothetical protein
MLAGPSDHSSNVEPRTYTTGACNPMVIAASARCGTLRHMELERRGVRIGFRAARRVGALREYDALLRGDLPSKG